MKRTGNLIAQIACLENLMLAYYKAKRGKETKPEVLAYSKNLNHNLGLLKQQIQTGDIEVGNYHYFTIYDPKKRQICAASFAERVLHHALMNVCHPVFEQYQIWHNYATRPQKGTHKAIEKAAEYQKQYGYYLKMDVRKYFDSIDHAILLQQLTKEIKDTLLLAMFSKIISSYQTNPGKGIPIGNLSSQYFANHYLATLDHFIKEQLRIKPYIRYMDDFVVWHNNPHELNKIGQSIVKRLAETLCLQLKTSALNTCQHGLSFLGYRLFPYKMCLTARSKKRYIAKTSAINKKLQNASISQAQYVQQATCLNNFVRPTNFIIHADRV